MSEAAEIGAGRPRGIDINQPGTPVGEHVRLTVRRLDDNEVKRSGILAVGEEERPIEEMDGPAHHHQSYVVRLQHCCPV